MKAKKLLELLRDRDPNAEVMLYLGYESGFSIVPIGMGDAQLGWLEDGTVLLPAEPDKASRQAWQDTGTGRSVSS